MNDVNRDTDAQQFLDRFRCAVVVIGTTTPEDQWGIPDYKRFLACERLSEADGDELLVRAFRVCPPLDLFPLLAIVTRTKELSARVRVIARERIAHTIDPNKQVWWDRILLGLVCIHTERANA